MTFKYPESVVACANILKCVYANYNLYLLMAEDNVKIIELLMITNPPEADELQYLLSFVFDNGMRPIVSENGDITMKDYYAGIKCIADFIYNLELELFNSEVCLLDAEKIEKAKDKVRYYLKDFKEDVNRAMELIFTESLRA